MSPKTHPAQVLHWQRKKESVYICGQLPEDDPHGIASAGESREPPYPLFTIWRSSKGTLHFPDRWELLHFERFVDDFVSKEEAQWYADSMVVNALLGVKSVDHS